MNSEHIGTTELLVEHEHMGTTELLVEHEHMVTTKNLMEHGTHGNHNAFSGTIECLVKCNVEEGRNAQKTFALFQVNYQTKLL